jgi:transposase
MLFFYLCPMGRVNTPILSESAKLALEQGLKAGKTHTFRTRCQVILLKSAGRDSKEVGKITGMTYVSVNSWVKRYKDLGVDGLQTQSGRGPKRKLNKEADKESILESVKAHRQRIQTAKAEWEQKSGKSVSLSTLKSFLKALTVDINE